MDDRSDAELVALARDGDQEAFAVLYDRYFDGVYDFVARMLRNRDEAADIAQDTFLKAMGALPSLNEGARFKSWLFSIARNTALNRIERAGRTRPLAMTDEDGETVEMDIVDPDRFASPEEAVSAAAIASLVWEASAGLDPRHVSVLHMHLREGMESAEIADALGITRNNGYVMLNRMKKAVEEAIGAFIMWKEGRRYCAELDAVLSRAEASAMTPAVRRTVGKHVNACEACQEERKKLVSPLAVFGAFAPVGAPPGLKEQIFAGVRAEWASSGPGATSAATGLPPGEGGIAGLAGAGGPGRWLAGLIGGGAIVAGVLAALIVPFSPFALTSNDDGTSSVIPLGIDGMNGGDDGGPGGGVTPSPSPSLADGADGDDTDTVSSQPTADAAGTEPAETPEPGETAVAPVTGASPTATEEPTATSEPTPGGTPTSTSTATPTPLPPTPTPTATATPTPSPTATPTPCVPDLQANVPAVTMNAANPGWPSSSFTIRDTRFCGSVSYSIQIVSGADWVRVAPASGTLTNGATRTIGVTVDPGSLPGTGEGTFNAMVRATAGSSNVDVQIVATRQGAPPFFIRSPQASCSDGVASFAAEIDDDYGVVSVQLTYGSGHQTSMTHQGGTTWTRTLAWPRGEQSFQVRAVDGAGQSVMEGASQFTCTG